MNRPEIRSTRGARGSALDHPRRVLIGIVAWALVMLCLPRSAPAQDRPGGAGLGARAASLEQIAQWIRELDDGRFMTRRNATEQLIASGLAAVGPVRQALSQCSLEVSARGIYVLKALALSKDVSAQDAATEALEALAQSPVRATARQAGEVLAQLSEARQEQAIQELEDLGARLDMQDAIAVFAPAVGMRVEIGPKWQGTAQDLQRLRRLPAVQQVLFIGPQCTDAWIRSLEDLPGVERVLIRNASITDEAVKSLSRLPRVTAIELLYAPVSDASLEPLKQIKTLRKLRLYGTAMTPDAVARFQAAVAQVEVDFRMGAFLGVMCDQPPSPCRVLQVVPDAAAAQAGIADEDIIVRYGGQPVAHFDDLRALISKNKAGDSVLIQVMRGATRLNNGLPQRGNLALGVEAVADSFGCRVTRLADDGAAAQAGVRVDDVVVELNGQPVARPEQLSQAFGQLSADEPLVFGVIRNGRIVSVRVTFGEWTDVIQ